VASKMQIDRRRVRARELRFDGCSLREIARRLEVSKSTIEADLRIVAPERLPAPACAAGPGNLRTAKHGVYSERLLGPVRERHGRELAVRYPSVDPARRAAEAQRRAMIELASAWLDERGIVRDDSGVTYDIAVKLAAWLAASEKWMRDVDDESHRPSQGGGVEALIERGQQIMEAREVNDDG
jgi:hypothetical protein